jgi:hypothetical protein
LCEHNNEDCEVSEIRLRDFNWTLTQRKSEVDGNNKADVIIQWHNRLYYWQQDICFLLGGIVGESMKR